MNENRNGEKMRAVVFQKYGPPDVLGVAEVSRPIPKEDEVLVRVLATTATAAESALRKGEPFATRLYMGLMKPKITTLGGELAGVVEAIGSEVLRFKVGDAVFAATGDAFGAHAEYVCLKEDGVVAVKPSRASYEEAAAACEGVLTALPFLRDKAYIDSSKNVLIIGASGSIGTFAVQLAKYFGATVTGVCSAANVDLVRSLGADHVIDYTTGDFTQMGEVYDIIFDTVGKSSYARCKPVLSKNGIYLSTVLSMTLLLQTLWTAGVGSKKAKFTATGLRPAHEKTKDLLFAKDLIERGYLRSVIDRSYPLEQTAEAFRYVETGHKKGNVVILPTR